MEKQQIVEELEKAERYFSSIRECIKRGMPVSYEFKRSVRDNTATTVTFRINGGAETPETNG